MAREVREEELVKQVLATALPEWRNPKLLDSGSFGVTYRVKHADGKPFAVLKVFRPDAAILKTFSTQNVLERFAREVNVLKSISHPRIPKLLAEGLRNDPPWFLMQFFAGPTVKDLVDNDEPLVEEIWFRAARDLLGALNHAHSKGAIHKDLNPGNVIVTPQGASLIDFGVAALVQDAYVPYAGGVQAHLAYLSPEQLKHSVVTGKSDVFSLASLLTFAGSGRHPWGADPTEIGSRIVSAAPDYSGLTASQQKLLKVMHEKSPDARANSEKALALLDSLYQPAKIGTRRSASSQSRPVVVPAQKQADAGPVVKKLEQVAQRLEAREKELKAKRVKLRPMSYLRPLLGFMAGSGVLFSPIVLGYWAWKSRPSRIMKRLFLASIATMIGIGVIAGSTPTGQEAPASATVLLIVSAALGLFAGAVRSMIVEGLPLSFIWRGYKALEPTPERTARINDKAHGAIDPLPQQRDGDTESAMMTDFDPDRGLGVPLKSWNAVREVVKLNLEERAGKQFLIEMDTSDIDGIFFQGYPEENGAITIEAASDLSLRPHITPVQFQAMLKLGWEPPSDGLPNFIQFLDLSQSSSDAVADLIIRTMRDGYGVTLESLASA